ncbi:hypothetical protein [Psychrobacter lutiphocae]|uniref:hypothetical protein n=1 Tax=Psychrobacter lutiphocae TaxID=540500 RepID=UPI00038025B8|nr:hypothetical protein [Psychrobacter lutiphocae]
MKVSRSLQSTHIDSPSYRSTLSKKVLKHSITTALAAVALSGCQSTPFTGQHQSSALTAIMASQPASEQQSLLAQQTLLQAMQKQRKTAYRYRIDMIGSNQSRLAAFRHTTNQQLAMSDVSETHCEHLHDEAYASLLARAESENTDIEDEKYSTQRRALKSAFIDCKTKQVDWENSRYSQVESSTDASISNTDILAVEEQLSSEMVEDDDTGSDKFNQQLLDELLTSLNIDTPQDRFLPNYDSAHTKLDARKAKLLDAYLLKPTSISVQGIYQPLLGRMTITPTLRYQSPNLTSIANHYIYLDAKQGAIYFWADTYAYLLSVYFDEQLGTSMHNKWLKLDLNDDSLPEGFGKDLIMSHFAAKDKALQQIPTQRYRILTHQQLMSSEPIESRFIPYIQDTPYVIERRLTDEDVERYAQIYFDSLYQQIIDKYPQLKRQLPPELESAQASTEVLSVSEAILAATEAEESAEEDRKFKEWAQAESAINYDETVGFEQDTDEKAKNETTSRYSSRQLIQTLLSLIENSLQTEIDAIDNETNSSADNLDELSEPTHNPNINYALYDPNSAESSWLWRDVYAIDSSKRIQWQFKQYKLDDDIPADEQMDVFRGIELQSLTRFEPASITASVFTTLPDGATTPNAENTINIREYSQTLLQRYDEGGGAPMGRKIVEAIKNGVFPIIDY